MTFLCDQHRKQALKGTSAAINLWEQWMQQGSKLFDLQLWQMATSYLGCSFEVAEWLANKPVLVQDSKAMRKNDSQGLNPTDRYMITGHHLAECLGRSGQTDAELHYLLTVHLKLLSTVKNRSYRYWQLKHNLEISLAMLRRYCQAHGQFRGYHDCDLETRLCIEQLRQSMRRQTTTHCYQAKKEDLKE